MNRVKLKILPDEFSVYRFPPDTEIPPEVLKGQLYFIGKTNNELSIICSSRYDSTLSNSRSSCSNCSKPQPSARTPGRKVERGWSCIEVLGPLDFGITGLLSGIASHLAEHKISILAQSTFDTDYIFFKSSKLNKAAAVLKNAGYIF